MDNRGEDPPRPVSRRSGLRPPPGFENLASNQGTEAGEGSTPAASSSSVFGAINGIFPFPPARPKLAKSELAFSFPPPSDSSSDSDRSTLPEVSSEYSVRDQMEATNAFFQGHHHLAMVALLKQKFQEILGYDEAKNRKILHLDWVAANPSDPANEKGSDAATGGMSSEDRELSNSVARSVMRITHGILDWEPKEAWNKPLFYGDWLYDPKGLRQFFVEIQVKRISGADDALLEQCGVSSKQVWLALQDSHAPAIEPVTLPAGVAKSAIPALLASRGLSVPHDLAFDAIAEVEYAAPAPAPSLQVPTCSADKGKGRAETPGLSSPGLDLAREETDTIVPTSPGQSSNHPRPLPNIATLALAHASPNLIKVPPRSGIPRSTYQPLPITEDFDPLNPPRAMPPTNDDDDEDSGLSTDESFNEDEEEGTVYLGDGQDPFASLPSAHDTPALSAADLHAHRAEFDRSFQDKLDEITTTYAKFENDPAFIARKNKSFVYAVRVLAIPDKGNAINVFSGPRSVDRYGTLLAQGGWVVPPLEERIAWRDAHKRQYKNKGAKAGKYEGLPHPKVDIAVPCRLDWTCGVTPRYFGQAPPLWRELSEPCLEDVYWMVWQLVSGKQFVGFRPGTGFGVPRPTMEGDLDLVADCPFKSPSVEAVYHAASYPRGDETKK